MEFTKQINKIIESITENFDVYFERKDKVSPDDMYTIIYDSIINLSLDLDQDVITGIIRISITQFICSVGEKLNLEEIKSKNKKEKENKKKQIASLYLFLRNVSNAEINNISEKIHRNLQLKRPSNLKEAFRQDSIDNYEDVLLIVEHGFGKLSSALQKISEKLNENEQKLFLNDIFVQRNVSNNNVLRLSNRKTSKIFITKLIDSFYANIQKGFGKLVEHLFFKILSENRYTLKYESTNSNNNYSDTITNEYIKNIRSSYKLIKQYEQFITMDLKSFNSLESVYKELNSKNDTRYNETENLNDLKQEIEDFVNSCFYSDENKKIILESFSNFIKNISKVENITKFDFSYNLKNESKVEEINHLDDASKITKIEFDNNIIIPNSASEIFDCYLSCDVTYINGENNEVTTKIEKFIGLDVKFYNNILYEKQNNLINIIDNNNKISVTSASPLKISREAKTTLIVAMFKISSKSKLKSGLKSSDAAKLKRIYFKREMYEYLAALEKTIELNCDFGYKAISNFLKSDRKISTLNKSIDNFNTLQEINYSYDSSYDTNILVSRLVSQININDSTKFQDVIGLKQTFTMFLPVNKKEITINQKDNIKTIKRDVSHMCAAYYKSTEKLEKSSMLNKLKIIEKNKTGTYDFISSKIYLQLLIDYLISNDSDTFSIKNLEKHIKNIRKSYFMNEFNFSFTTDRLVYHVKENLINDNKNLYVNVCADIINFFKNYETEIAKIEQKLKSLTEYNNINDLVIALFKENYVLKVNRKRKIYKNCIKDIENYKISVENFIDELLDKDEVSDSVTQEDNLISQDHN